MQEVKKKNGEFAMYPNRKLNKANATQIWAIGLALVFGVFSSSGVYADKCGKNDRVSLPGCASVDGNRVTNNCSFSVTVKWDVAGAPDNRKTIGPGKSATGGFFPLSTRKISCCPRYGRCR